MVNRFAPYETNVEVKLINLQLKLETNSSFKFVFEQKLQGFFVQVLNLELILIFAKINSFSHFLYSFYYE